MLDLESGSFRTYLRWKTPALIDKDDKLVPLPEPAKKGQKDEDRKPVPAAAGELPAEGWTAPGFDEGRWPRARGAVAVWHRHITEAVMYSPPIYSGATGTGSSSASPSRSSIRWAARSAGYR